MFSRHHEDREAERARGSDIFGWVEKIDDRDYDLSDVFVSESTVTLDFEDESEMVM